MTMRKVEQKGVMSHLWVRCKPRPRVVSGHRYGWRYLLGAACGSRRAALALASERANTTERFVSSQNNGDKNYEWAAIGW